MYSWIPSPFSELRSWRQELTKGENFVWDRLRERERELIKKLGTRAVVLEATLFPAYVIVWTRIRLGRVIEGRSSEFHSDATVHTDNAAPPFHLCQLWNDQDRGQRLGTSIKQVQDGSVSNFFICRNFGVAFLELIFKANIIASQSSPTLTSYESQLTCIMVLNNDSTALPEREINSLWTQVDWGNKFKITICSRVCPRNHYAFTHVPT